MRVLVTGSEGFIGKNLRIKLAENFIDYTCFSRLDSPNLLPKLLENIDFVFHLAGVNRPSHPDNFASENIALTQALCDAVQETEKAIPIAFTSSIQASLNNPYGVSKRLAEEALIQLHTNSQSPIYLYRLPNVFGKWAKPDYNSVVATFCHNIAQGIPIRIDEPNKIISLLYIDDLINSFINILGATHFGIIRPIVSPIYSISVDNLANQINTFHNKRVALECEEVGNGLIRALYATYLSYLKPEQFFYKVTAHEDSRGRFVEMLKTKHSGQFSFFTAHPGVTRGRHYHHTKSEKFFVVKGSARFRFRNILSNDAFELDINEKTPKIVDTIPGWTHDVTNIGTDELIVMLWSSEVFDRAKPDTIAHKI